jgi:enoyl-CoA hydratase/carnithine racemase
VAEALVADQLRTPRQLRAQAPISGRESQHRAIRTGCTDLARYSRASSPDDRDGNGREVRDHRVRDRSRTGGGRSMTELLLVERVERNGIDVAVVTFNRPEQRNPIDKATIAAVRALLTEFAQPGGPRAVILTGSGDAFSAGGDLKGYQQLYRDPVAFRRFLEDYAAVGALLEKSQLLVVAMVNGTCVAGGLELALTCDFVTISSTARIGDGHLRFAQLPGAGGSQRLVRAIGVQRARHWLLTGRLFPASVAVEAGLALFASPPEQLRDDTLDLVAEVCATTPLGLSQMKALINIAQNSVIEDGLRAEFELVYRYATESHDATEGLMAFGEHRPARYLGR